MGNIDAWLGRTKTLEQLLEENALLAGQLAKLQARASALLEQRGSELEQLNNALEYLHAQLKEREATIAFLQAKLCAFRKIVS
ncbi:hypothetical protein [Limnobacter sp.]|uniref:hypothetical protein n=1 Tax=Limnobacter sp. TaxID=2003368 RepID=UPI003512803F